jgi:small subunit ribosomal protein S4
VSRTGLSVCKQCRREGLKLFLKGERCFSDKCAIERRAYPPGQHGQSRMKFSEFALQLREKQKAKRYYGIFERQFRKYFADAERMPGQSGVNLLQRLEMRFDNVVWIMGLAASRKEARQLIKHNHFNLNGKRMNMPGAILKVGDIVEVTEKSREVNKVMGAIEAIKRREIPAWVEVDHGNFKGTVKEVPGREVIGVPVEENMIVEYYSR